MSLEYGGTIFEHIWRVSFVGELGHDGVELVKGEAFVGGGLVVDVGAVHQFEEFVIVDVFVELFGDGFELFEVNASVFVLVEETEDYSESVFGLGLSDTGSDDVEEFVEGDWFVFVSESGDE